MNSKMKVLVTAIGTVNGSTVVAELKKNNIYTIGANSTPREYVVTSKFVDEYYEFPSAVENQSAYLDFVLAFCKVHCITHLICFIDEEVEYFTRNRVKFENIGVKLCLADYNTVSICHFKDIFADWVADNYPEIEIKRFSSRLLSSVKFPVFVKPIEGRASIGCQAIRNSDELDRFFKDKDPQKYLIQQLITGDIVGVDIIRNRNFNQIFVIQKQEIIRNSNGCGTVVKIIDDQSLRTICTTIAEKLDLNGLVNAEFFMSTEGPRIIEINPRLPAGTSFSCFAGGDTVLNSIRIADGEPCVISAIRVGKVYARRYETYEM